MRSLQLLTLCICIFMDPDQSEIGEFESLVRAGTLSGPVEDSTATIGDAFLGKSSIYEDVGQSQINAGSGSQPSLHLHDSQSLFHEHVPELKHLDTFMHSSDVAVPRADFNRALFEARLQGVGDAELKMPWETGVMREIFSETDDDSSMHAVFPFEYLGIPEASATVETAQTTAEVARSSVCDNLDMPFYSFAVKVKPDRDMFAERDALWDRAIGKWQQVFEILSFPGALGEALEFESLYSDPDSQGVVLRDALGIKSPRTAIKRAQTMLQFFKWMQSSFSDWDPWNRARCLQYLATSVDGAPPASRGMALLEALRFSRFVMQIPIPESILGDSQLKGRAQRLMLSKEVYKPARPLRASEVMELERGMTADLNTIDKYLLGATLFCLYSRSRWSDVQHLDQLWIDRSELNGEIFGFLESRTVFHKTATTLKKKKIFMPIVCPILGITNIDWTSEWIRAMTDLGVELTAVPFGALCRAPNADGSLCRRSCTSDEIGIFLNRFLKLSKDNSVSSHSMKHTTLAWCSAYGMDEPSRTLLGHHELQGSKSMAFYSRDMLTRPLQAYCAMLTNIRGDHFRPDESRTSRLLDIMNLPAADAECQLKTSTAAPLAANLGRTDDAESEAVPTTPLESEPGRGQPASGDDSGTSEIASTSSDSSGDSDVGKEEGAVEDFIEGPIWRNCKSHVVHRCGTSRNQTQCGRFISEPNFEFLAEGCTTISARCSRCFKGEVISKIDDMVNALDRVKAKRLRKA